MAADVKSHVLLRDEKGLLGIPFKRWLLAGVGGGLVYTVSYFGIGSWSIGLAVVCAMSILALSGLRGGIPLWQRWLYGVRGWVLLRAARHPKSWLGQLAAALDLPVSLVRLEGEKVFAPPTGEVQIDLREWITFAHAGERDGLVFVDAPLQEGLDG